MIKNINSLNIMSKNINIWVGYEFRKPWRDGVWELGFAYGKGMGCCLNLLIIYIYINKIYNI